MLSQLDLSHLGYEDFVKGLFDHDTPMGLTEEPWYSGVDVVVSVPATLIRNCTTLFRDFAAATTPYTPAQVNQGVWLLLGGTVWLGNVLADRANPLEDRICCIESMYSVFRDYVSGSKLEEMPNVFYMWWKVLITARPVTDNGAFDHCKDHLQTREAIFRTLKRILALPDKRAQIYSLHGLAYLDHPEVPDVVQQWLAANRDRLSREEVDWVQRVRDGEFRSSS
jgi:hypothetical protein